MVRPWVELGNYQCEQLKKLKEKIGKPVSEIIWEAVSRFVRKRDYPISIAALYVPRARRDKYKIVTTYLPRSDWNLLVRISENTGRSKSELIRETVGEYLREDRKGT